MSKYSPEFIKSIAILLKGMEDGDRDIFAQVFKEKINNSGNDNLILRVYRELVSNWEGEENLLNGLIDERVLKVFTKNVYESVNKSNINTDGFNEISKEDVKILHWLQNKECNECLDYLKKTLNSLSNFISNAIFNTNFNVNNNEGIKGFLVASNIPDLIFYATLLLYKKEVFDKGIEPELKALYESRLFQYDIFFRTSSQEQYRETLMRGRAVAVILWSLWKDKMNFQSGISISYKDINNRWVNAKIPDIVYGIMSTKLEHFSWDIFGIYLKGIEEHSLTYKFLESVEGINVQKTEPFKNIIAEWVVDNTKEKKVLVDFARFLKEYANNKYLERIKTLTEGSPDWFKALVKENLEGKSEVLWEKTCEFLSLEPIVEEWRKDKELVDSIKDFLKKRLEDESVINGLLKSGDHYLLNILQKFTERTNRKLTIPFVLLGEKICESLIGWFSNEPQSSQINMAFVKIILKYFERFISEKEIPTFTEKFKTLIKDKFSNLDSERFAELYDDFLKPLLEPYLNQEYIQELGRKVIGDKFKKSELKVFITLVDTAGFIKDDIGLKENIESLMHQGNVDNQILELLEKLKGYIR